MRSDGLLLTVILSTGEPMPVHYQDQMGSTFVDYLLGNLLKGLTTKPLEGRNLKVCTLCYLLNGNHVYTGIPGFSI